MTRRIRHCIKSHLRPYSTDSFNLKKLQLENQLNNILVHNNTDKDDGDIVQSMYPYGYFLLCSKKLILKEGGYWHNRGKKCMEVLASSTSLLGKLIWCQTSWER